MNQGTERIVQRILADARSRADTIIAEANGEAARTIAGAEKVAADQQRQALKRTELKADEQKQCILGAFQLEARKNLLQIKRDLVEAVFEQALNELSNMEQQSYFQLLAKMLLAVAEKGDETIILSPRDKERVAAEFWEDLNARLKKSGRKGQLVLAEETRDIRGGAILQTAGVEINNSFDALLEMCREDLEPAVVAMLFEDE